MPLSPCTRSQKKSAAPRKVVQCLLLRSIGPRCLENWTLSVVDGSKKSSRGAPCYTPLGRPRRLLADEQIQKCRGIRRANSDRYVAFSLSSVAFSATTSAMGSRHKSLASGAATTQRKTTTSTRAIRHPRGRSQKQERTGVQRPRAIDAERVARRRPREAA